MNPRQPSLKTRLVTRQLALQFLAIAAAAIGLATFFVNSSLDGMYADEAVVKLAAAAIVRDAAGAALVEVTPALAELQEEAPDLWFAARLHDGDVVTFGQVPAELVPLVPHLHKLSSADLRGQFAPFTLSAVVRQASGAAGGMHILAHGRVQPFSVLIATASNVVGISIFLALALVSVLATPVIVRRALAGVVRTAGETARIDGERRGVRLPEDGVPREIGPLVRGFNQALERLDQGHERRERFIASAAHELRTPIAILRMKVEASHDRGVRSLLPDVLRLVNVSEQLLDLHRLDHGAPPERIDLGALARGVAADLAPLLIASGKSIAVVVTRPGTIVGHAGSLERALTNLVQNAVEHGGDAVVVRVDGPCVEVEDDGPGIPAEERERVFEPFHRLRPRASGTGLGLNLARQVVDHHRGRITLANAPGGGTIARMEFAAAA